MFVGFRCELDSKYAKTERRIYKFKELFEEIDGTIRIMILIGSWLIGMFSEKLYISETISDIYFFDKGSEHVDGFSHSDNKITPANTKELFKENKTKKDNSDNSDTSIGYMNKNEPKKFRAKQYKITLR